MKLGIVTCKDENEKWGGDLKAIYSIHEGLKEIGQDVNLGRSVQELKDADLVFLSNSSIELKSDFEEVQKSRQIFGIIFTKISFSKHQRSLPWLPRIVLR